MVRTEGADKRTTARFLAYGVNGLAVALMIVVFAYTAGLTGAEVGIAGGSRRARPEAARGRLRRPGRAQPGRASPRRSSRPGCGQLLDEERHRYLDLLDSLALDPEAAEQLRDAARAVDDLRYASAEPHSLTRLSTALRRLVPGRTGGHSSVTQITCVREGADDVLARGCPQAGRLAARTWATGSRPSSRPVEAARGRLDDAGRRPGRGRVVERAASRLRLSADHTVVATRRCHRLRQVVDVQRPDRSRARPRSAYAVPRRRGPPRACGASDGARSCSSGSASRRGTRSCATPCSTSATRGPGARRAWSCSTCPTTTRPRSSHHLEVDRLVELADLMVWVLDPQKYADAAVHDRYLAPLATPPGRDDGRAQPHRRGARRPAASRCSTTSAGCSTQDGLERGAGDRHQRPHGRGHRRAARRDRRPGARTRRSTRQRLEADLRAAAAAARRGERHAASPALARSEPRRRPGGRLRRRRRGADRGRRGRAVDPAARRPGHRLAGDLLALAAAARPAQAAAPRPRHRRARSSPAGRRTSMPEADPGAAGAGRHRGARRRRRRVGRAVAGRGRRPSAGPRSRGCADLERPARRGARPRPTWASRGCPVWAGARARAAVAADPGRARRARLARASCALDPQSRVAGDAETPDYAGFPVPMLLLVGGVVLGILLALLCRFLVAAHRAVAGRARPTGGSASAVLGGVRGARGRAVRSRARRRTDDGARRPAHARFG